MIKTIITKKTDYPRTYQLAVDISTLTGNYYSPSIFLPELYSYDIQVDWTGLDALDGTVTPEQSSSGINYNTIPNATSVAMSSASGSGGWTGSKGFASNNMRVFIDIGTITTGIVTITWVFKKVNSWIPEYA